MTTLSGSGTQRGLTLLEVIIAIIVLGIGVCVFMRMEGGAGSNLSGNSKMMRAGQLIEKHIEAIRINIARDTVANWPPPDTTYKESGLRLTRRVTQAKSPATGAVLPNVRRVDVIVTWGAINTDSLDVTTYVARRF